MDTAPRRRQSMLSASQLRVRRFAKRLPSGAAAGASRSCDGLWVKAGVTVLLGSTWVLVDQRGGVLREQALAHRSMAHEQMANGVNMGTSWRSQVDLCPVHHRRQLITVLRV